MSPLRLKVRAEMARQQIGVFDLSKRAGVDCGNLSRFVNINTRDNQKNPSLDTIGKIFRALGLSLAELDGYYDEVIPRPADAPAKTIVKKSFVTYWAKQELITRTGFERCVDTVSNGSKFALNGFNNVHTTLIPTEIPFNELVGLQGKPTRVTIEVL